VGWSGNALPIKQKPGQSLDNDADPEQIDPRDPERFLHKYLQSLGLYVYLSILLDSKLFDSSVGCEVTWDESYNRKVNNEPRLREFGKYDRGDVTGIRPKKKSSCGTS
jgi:hypothetical protein